jgi:pimeloyl-ACP methyl ester carboxylesterase
MSFGGLTSIALTRLAPELVARLILVDVTPGVTEAKSSHIRAFMQGPESFASFDDILARTVEFNPNRTVSSLRRGILHNAVQQPDGSWVWRYRRFPDATRRTEDRAVYWDDLSALRVPLMLVRGMLPDSVVDDADEAELVRRCPEVRVEHVAGAGHSVQGDAPLQLVSLIDDFVP